MEKFYTVTIWLTDRHVSYEHVPDSSLSFGTQTSYVKFRDKDGRQHFFFNATVTVDEESPADAESVSASDEP